MATYDVAGRTKTSFSFGGGSNNVISSDSGSYWVDLGGGDDQITLLGGNDTIIGGSGTDSILGGSGNDVIYMGSVTTDRSGNVTNPSAGVSVRTTSSDDANGGLGEDTIYGQSNSGKGFVYNTMYGDETSNAYSTFSADMLQGGDNIAWGKVINTIYGDCMGAPTNQDDIRVTFGDDQIIGGIGARNTLYGDTLSVYAIYYDYSFWSTNFVQFGDDEITLGKWQDTSYVYGDLGTYFINENGRLLCGDDTISFSTVATALTLVGDSGDPTTTRNTFTFHGENFITGKDTFVFRFDDAVDEVLANPTRQIGSVTIMDFEIDNDNDLLKIAGASADCVSIAYTTRDAVVTVNDTTNTHQLAVITIIGGATSFTYDQIDFSD